MLPMPLRTKQRERQRRTGCSSVPQWIARQGVARRCVESKTCGDTRGRDHCHCWTQRLTAYAFNRDNVKSNDAQLPLTGAESLRRAGTAYIIAVGINEYQNSQYNLKYAVADAESFGDEVRLKSAQVGAF